ncbi:MAG: hypothetical protein EXQ87_02970 [Alphaproteobacteria bacterium]|nr:hypothetical protein [Alphaproteobacteria bacterium]
MTVFWLVAAAMIVAAMFGIAYQTEERERELRRLRQAILTDQAAIHVLTAEWAYLTQPVRIQALNARHLHLVPVESGRMIKPDDLPARLGAYQAAPELPPTPAAKALPPGATALKALPPGATAPNDSPPLTYTRAPPRGQAVR